MLRPSLSLKSSLWRRWPLAVLCIGGIVALLTQLPVTNWLVAVVEWTRLQGSAGPFLFAVAYVVATVLLLPGLILTIGSGFVWGPLWGLLLISPVSVLAASLAFMLSRTIARNQVMRRLGSDPRLAALDAAVEQHGFKIVLLLRLSPLFPFNTINYLLGLTRVRMRDFILGSWIGLLPVTALYTYLGSMVTKTSELASGAKTSPGPFGNALFALGVVSTIGVTILLTRIARRALTRAVGGI